jgi:ferritin-like metal-binding protein YciE
MAKEPKQLDELFHDTLKDIYYAEKKILTALPKMAKAAQNDDLRAAFEKHEGETEEQVSRLEQVFELIEEEVRCDRRHPRRGPGDHEGVQGLACA